MSVYKDEKHNTSRMPRMRVLAQLQNQRMLSSFLHGCVPDMHKPYVKDAKVQKIVTLNCLVKNSIIG